MPFSETDHKIAFLTRQFGEDDKVGEIFLNILSVELYSRNMKFQLYTSHYGACLDEGMGDDCIQKCIVTQVTSYDDKDVALVA